MTLVNYTRLPDVDRDLADPRGHRVDCSQRVDPWATQRCVDLGEELVLGEEAGRDTRGRPLCVCAFGLPLGCDPGGSLDSNAG